MVILSPAPDALSQAARAERKQSGVGGDAKKKPTAGHSGGSGESTLLRKLLANEVTTAKSSRL